MRCDPVILISGSSPCVDRGTNIHPSIHPCLSFDSCALRNQSIHANSVTFFRNLRFPIITPLPHHLTVHSRMHFDHASVSAPSYLLHQSIFGSTHPPCPPKCHVQLPTRSLVLHLLSFLQAPSLIHNGNFKRWNTLLIKTETMFFNPRLCWNLIRITSSSSA